MKVTFPYMGCVLGYKKLLSKLGHEIIMPQKPTKRTFELGVKYSPEFLCYPFKVITGTYLEAAEKGVELIVASGGTGPCRAGYYTEIQKRILKQEGYDIQIITFDSVFQNPGEFIKKILTIKNKTSIVKVVKSLFFTYHLINYMDNLEKRLKILRAYEVEKNSFNKVWSKIENIFDKCETVKELKIANREATALLESVERRKVDEEHKLRVGIVGEIYVIMESSTNMEIEQKLNELGVEVENVQYISEWVRHNTIPRVINNEKSHQVLKKSDKYNSLNCGGHDKENMGWIVDFAERGFDAVVHLMPFGCLPELVTRSVIPSMSEDLGMPILSISLDEQTGTVNLQTRIEAFIELVKSKKFVSSRIIDLKPQKVELPPIHNEMETIELAPVKIAQ